MTTPNKTLCTVRTFSFKNKACYPIRKLLNTIYEHYIDKHGVKGGIKHCFWCKASVFLYVWQYVKYVTNFTAYYILLNSLNDTSKGILFHSRTDFCVK